MKRILLLISSVVVLVVNIMAAVPTGGWFRHSSFTIPSQQIVTCNHKVFFLSGGELFSYDYENDGMLSYSSTNMLNGNNIKFIKDVPEAKLLVIVYDSGNMDLLYYNDERVVNVSDIYDSDNLDSRTIRDVAYGKGRLYIGTDFGLVEYSLSTHTVLQSAIMDNPVDAVAFLGEDMIVTVVDGSVYWIGRNERLHGMDGFVKLNGFGKVQSVNQLGDSHLLVHRLSGDVPNLHLTVYHYNNKNHSYNGWDAVDGVSEAKAPFYGGDGNLYSIADDGTIVCFSSDGKYSKLKNIPAIMQNSIIGVGKKGLKDVWCMDVDGVANYNLSETTPVVLMEKVRPENITVKNVAWITPSYDGSRTYFNNMQITNYRKYVNEIGDGLKTIQQTFVIDENDNIKDVAARGYTPVWELATENQKKIGTDHIMGAVRVAEDPNDKDTYWLATSTDGLVKITKGKSVGNFTEDNSPVPFTFGWRVFDVVFDRESNMWITYSDTNDGNAIAMLPADKCMKKPSEIKKSDWKKVKAASFTGTKDSRILICRKSNMIFVYDTRLATSGLVAIDTKGTYSNISDDKVEIWHSFTDQDGKTFTPIRFTASAEDMDGHVWLGSNMGVISINSPNTAVNTNMVVNRIKVPRNDGTNSADYLLGSDYIYDISVDNANRKWIATESSGLYLVNDNGSEILEHFTSENSPLPVNTVNCVYASTKNNSVYIGTAYGLYEYGSSASPQHDDYSAMYAYPNPVRPDYSGPITITGVSDGAILRIADSASNVVATLTAEGGMAVWDGTVNGGARVRSGVYYVFASPGSEGGPSKGDTCKIMVIN